MEKSPLLAESTSPLAGVHALVTRPRRQASPLAELLEAAGAKVSCEPTIRIVPPSRPAELSDALSRLPEYDCLVLTSPNGVTRFAAASRDSSASALPVTLVAIGPGTANAMKAEGMTPTLVANRSNGEGLAEAIIAHYGVAAAGSQVLLPRAEVARPILPALLRQAGMQVDDVPSYRTVPVDAPAQSRIRNLIGEQQVNAALFTSPSTARNLLAILDGSSSQGLPERIVRVSIGPVTSEALRTLRIPPHVEASAPRVEALVEALKSHYIGRA